MSEAGLTSELIVLIGEDAFVRLVEEFGGTRLFVPHPPKQPGTNRKAHSWLRKDRPLQTGHELLRTVGRHNAEILAKHFSGSYIRVPLAREMRVRRYRKDGDSNAKIARKLGINETSVDKIIARMDAPPAKGGQLDLFDALEPRRKATA